MRILSITGFCMAMLSAMLFTFGCSQSRPAANAEPANGERLETVTAHSTDDRPPGPAAPRSNTSGAKTKWSQSGDPIDTRGFDADIAAAEKAFKSKTSDETARKSLADAYFTRGFALTEARQYASALGDYRRALKYDPGNVEAKQWIERIIGIYDSMNKESPKEGEEPPPLPFKKTST